MAKILIIVAIAAFGYLGYAKYFQTSDGLRKNEYSLATVEKRPVPKRELIDLWKDVALNRCENAKQDNNLTPNECRKKVNERSDTCHANASVDAPETIDSKELAKRVGHKYLECVTPYYFCNGKEAKTEDEVRRYCS